MRIDPTRGRCRECGGPLTIVDADDATMTVECETGHYYAVEHDAFGDGCMIDVLGYLAAQLEGADEP